MINHFLQSSGVDVSFNVFSLIIEKLNSLEIEFIPLYVIHDAIVLDIPKSSYEKIKKSTHDGFLISDLNCKFPIKIEVIRNKMSISTSKIEKNWSTFQNLIIKCCGEEGKHLLEELGERMIMCPSSMRKDQIGAYPGGMINTSLDITMQMRKANNINEICTDEMSLLRVGFFMI